jgi:hypothetical protein
MAVLLKEDYGIAVINYQTVDPVAVFKHIVWLYDIPGRRAATIGADS